MLHRKKLHHLTRFETAIDYIESRLGENLEIADVASQAHWSPYHFMRIFQAFTNLTYREYVRARRAEIAAYLLVYSEATLLDIALDVGYESQQSFGRAFAKVRGESPGAFRKRNCFTVVLPRWSISNWENYLHEERKSMTPNITNIESINLAGPSLRTQNDGRQHQQIPEFWERFYNEDTASRIRSRLEPTVVYGVCTDINKRTGEFSYVIGAEVEIDSEQPEVFSRCVVPQGRYAIFIANGTMSDGGFVDSIQSTWRFIFSQWFASNEEWQPDDRPEFERYDEKWFVGGMGRCEIFIPIKSAVG